MASASSPSRAWVLDTDIGWDPDDILALLLLALHCSRHNEPLAVVSSAEHSGSERSLSARRLLRDIGCQPDGKWLVAKGHAASPLDGRSVQPFAFGLRAVISDVEPEAISDFHSVANFVASHRAAGATVCWVGVGALTNLASLLANPSGPTPSRVVQMCAATVERKDGGGCQEDRVETNVRLDPRSCLQAFELCESRGVPLAVLSLDTTGYFLGWHSPAGRVVDVPAIWKTLEHRHPSVASFIRANTDPTGDPVRRPYYGASSSLHDPLTVLVAIATACESDHDAASSSSSSSSSSSPPSPSSTFVPFAPARVSFHSSGEVQHFKVDSGLLSRRLEAAPPAYGEVLRRFSPMKEGDVPNCKLALGPLLSEEVEKIVEMMTTMLS